MRCPSALTAVSTRLFILVACLFLLSSLPLAAAAWQPMGGPEGGTVLALAFDRNAPGVVLAGTAEDGVYRSADRGVSWQSSSEGLEDWTITTLTAQSGVIFAGTYRGGLYASRDSGRTWVPSLTSFPGFSGLGLNIQSAAADPARPGTLYAVIYQTALAKTTDGGRHWNKTASKPRGSLRSIAVDGGSPSVVYALTQEIPTQGRIWRSLDGGATWSAVGPTFHSDLSNLTVDPVTHAAYLGTATEGLLTSTDRGATWRKVRGFPSALGVTLLAANARTVYAGVIDKSAPFAGRGAYVSKDGGGTWHPANQGLGDLRLRALALAPGNPKSALAGVSGWGVFKSQDTGGSWSLASRGLLAMSMVQIAPDPFRPDTLYAGSTVAGVWKTSDGGRQWKPLRPVLAGSPVWALVIDPHRSNAVYAGTNHTLTRSLDGGLTWTFLDGGLAAADFFGHLRADPTRPSTLYAGTRHGLYRSGDGGDTWSPGVGAECTYPDRIAVASTGTVYLAGPEIPGCSGAPAGGVLVSHDAGLTWEFRGDLPEQTAYALVVDPASDSTLYAGFQHVFRSTDGGVTWERTDAFSNSSVIFSLIFGGSDLRTLYVGGSFGIRSSPDGGATWKPAGDNFSPYALVFGLAWNPLNGTLYSASDYGLFSLRPETP